MTSKKAAFVGRSSAEKIPNQYVFLKVLQCVEILKIVTENGKMLGFIFKHCVLDFKKKVVLPKNMYLMYSVFNACISLSL